MEEFGLSDIERKWIDEKTEEGVTELPEKFYSDAASYVSELTRELKISEDLRRELLEGELERILEMIQEIYFFRTLKMMDACLEGKESDLLPSERRAFDNIRRDLESLRDEFLSPALKGESELRHPRELSNVTILIFTSIPEPLVGSDMRYYGPFEKGDIVNLPEKTGDLLITQGLGRKVDVRQSY